MVTDTLCTRCGLCCDGTLFGDVELTGRREAARLEALGLDVDTDDADVELLALPCAGLRKTRCSVYAHRPQCCRTFECRLLQETERGTVSRRERPRTGCGGQGRGAAREDAAHRDRASPRRASAARRTRGRCDGRERQCRVGHGPPPRRSRRCDGGPYPHDQDDVSLLRAPSAAIAVAVLRAHDAPIGHGHASNRRCSSSARSNGTCSGRCDSTMRWSCPKITRSNSCRRGIGIVEVVVAADDAVAAAALGRLGLRGEEVDHALVAAPAETQHDRVGQVQLVAAAPLGLHGLGVGEHLEVVAVGRFGTHDRVVQHVPARLHAVLGHHAAERHSPSRPGCTQGKCPKSVKFSTCREASLCHAERSLLVPVLAAPVTVPLRYCDKLRWQEACRLCESRTMLSANT